MLDQLKVEMIPVSNLKHIEGFSSKRVIWLKDKILKEGVWNKPLSLDMEHCLVLDGQHRMEVAIFLGLKVVPVVKYDYATVKVWSLRKNHEFDWNTVVVKALEGNIYPYKTVKHLFTGEVPACRYSLEELYS
jgi:L-serine kinase (ADP)